MQLEYFSTCTLWGLSTETSKATTY